MLAQFGLPALRQQFAQQFGGGGRQRFALRQGFEHRAGAHRRQLVGIAQQHHAAAVGQGGQGLQQQAVVEHRRFVEQQHIQRQRVAGVKNRLHLRRAQAEQAVHGLSLQRRQMAAHGIVQAADFRHRLMQRLRHPRRRLAGRRRQRNARQAAVLAQQRQQLGNGSRFAGARPAADQHKVLQQRQRRRGLLVAAAGIGKPLLQKGAQLRQIFRRRGAGAQAQNLLRQIALQLPVPRQKQPPSVQHQRRLGTAADHRRRLRQLLRFVAAQIDKAVAVGQRGKQPRDIRRHALRRLRREFRQQRQHRRAQIIGGFAHGCS